jgi:hypothetical protein
MASGYDLQVQATSTPRDQFYPDEHKKMGFSHDCNTAISVAAQGRDTSSFGRKLVHAQDDDLLTRVSMHQTIHY